MGPLQARPTRRGDLLARAGAGPLPAPFNGRILALRRELEGAHRLDAGVVALARRLAGRCRIAALSNAGADLEAGLRRLGIDDLFEHVVNSHRVGMAKPDAAIFTYTARLLGAAPAQVLFVDDRARNTAAAERLEFATHRFRDVPALEQAIARHLG